MLSPWISILLHHTPIVGNMFVHGIIAGIEMVVTFLAGVIVFKNIKRVLKGNDSPGKWL